MIPIKLIRNGQAQDITFSLPKSTYEIGQKLTLTCDHFNYFNKASFQALDVNLESIVGQDNNIIQTSFEVIINSNDIIEIKITIEEQIENTEAILTLSGLAPNFHDENNPYGCVDLQCSLDGEKIKKIEMNLISPFVNLPIGTIYGFDSEEDRENEGWLRCDGTVTIDRDKYPELYELLKGTVENVNTPNLKNKVLVGTTPQALGYKHENFIPKEKVVTNSKINLEELFDINILMGMKDLPEIKFDDERYSDKIDKIQMLDERYDDNIFYKSILFSFPFCKTDSEEISNNSILDSLSKNENRFFIISQKNNDKTVYAIIDLNEREIYYTLSPQYKNFFSDVDDVQHTRFKNEERYNSDSDDYKYYYDNYYQRGYDRGYYDGIDMSYHNDPTKKSENLKIYNIGFMDGIENHPIQQEYYYNELYRRGYDNGCRNYSDEDAIKDGSGDGYLDGFDNGYNKNERNDDCSWQELEQQCSCDEDQLDNQESRNGSYNEIDTKTIYFYIKANINTTKLEIDLATLNRIDSSSENVKNSILIDNYKFAPDLENDLFIALNNIHNSDLDESDPNNWYDQVNLNIFKKKSNSKYIFKYNNEFIEYPSYSKYQIDMYDNSLSLNYDNRIYFKGTPIIKRNKCLPKKRVLFNDGKKVLACWQANHYTFGQESNHKDYVAQFIKGVKHQPIPVNNIPIGTIVPFLNAKILINERTSLQNINIPRGWIICDGGKINEKDHPELVALVGKRTPNLIAKSLTNGNLSKVEEINKNQKIELIKNQTYITGDVIEKDSTIDIQPVFYIIKAKP